MPYWLVVVVVVVVVMVVMVVDDGAAEYVGVAPHDRQLLLPSREGSAKAVEAFLVTIFGVSMTPALIHTYS